MSTDRVNLGQGWFATFDTDKAEAFVEKKVRHTTRQTLAVFNPPFVKLLRPGSRLPSTSKFNCIPPKAKDRLYREFVKRWGESGD